MNDRLEPLFERVFVLPKGKTVKADRVFGDAEPHYAFDEEGGAHVVSLAAGLATRASGVTEALRHRSGCSQVRLG
ncbi:MAG: hypothetical protein HC923_13615 [Myxococcales bacterium]|nr:hypothetical protein [Myxococcales bacterium]